MQIKFAKKLKNRTMKILKSIIVLLVLSITFTSCSKDDEPTKPTFPEENFLSEYLSKSGFGEKEFKNINRGTFEFGVEFTPKVKGKINSFVVKLPDANSSLRITLWDATAKTVIKTEMVDVDEADKTKTFAIDAIALTKDKKYMITMNSNDWFKREKTDGSEVTYPVEAGNINVEKYGYISGIDQVYPDSFYNDYYAGDLSFNFQQTE